MREFGFDFNDMFILECFLYREDRDKLDLFKIPSLEDFNLSQSLQKLKKEEYIIDDPNDSSIIIVSLQGKVAYKTIIEETPVETNEEYILRSTTNDEKFEEWWKTYPATGTWETNDGEKFISSRNLKNLRKPKAKEIYLKLLNQGLKHEDLIGALKYEIKLKKLDSIKKRENQMDYFKGMISYFNSGRYMTNIDDYKSNPKFIEDSKDLKSKKKNVTDI